jgi:hypothetical protein
MEKSKSILEIIGNIKNSLDDISNTLNNIEEKVISQEVKKRKAYIYAIEALDKNILDSYVGSTYCLTRREYNHNKDSKCCKSKLYNFVNANGGWKSVEFIILEEVEVLNKSEKFQMEQKWIKIKNPTLNTRRAFRTHDELKQQWREATNKYRNKKLII